VGGFRAAPLLLAALGSTFERRNNGIPTEGSKMSDWRIRHQNADGHDAQSIRSDVVQKWRGRRDSNPTI
jgi:hypothetical protein